MGEGVCRLQWRCFYRYRSREKERLELMARMAGRKLPPNGLTPGLPQALTDCRMIQKMSEGQR